MVWAGLVWGLLVTCIDHLDLQPNPDTGAPLSIYSTGRRGVCALPGMGWKRYAGSHVRDYPRGCPSVLQVL